MNRLPDLDARRTAATDFTRNLVVEAGAGTGKTSLLVERALVAVGRDVATIERIAAITFTEKAAGEMRQRLAQGLDRLRRLARGETFPETTEADRAWKHLRDEAGVAATTVAERALAAIESLDTSRVSTIHAFCAELLRAYPFEAGVDPDFGVDSGEQAESLRREEWERFLGEELGPNARRPELWREMLQNLGPRDLEQMAFDLAGFGMPRELVERHDPGPALELLRDEARGLVERIDTLLCAQIGLSPVPLAWMQAAREALDAFARQGLDAARAVIAGGDAQLRLRVVEGKPAPTANKKLADVDPLTFDRASRDSRSLLRTLAAIDDARLARILEALRPFALGFRERFLRRGVVDFDGLLALTRNLLRDAPDVRRALKRQFRVLLVDEFQDTDPLQYEIALFLAERVDDAAADPYGVRLEPGKLFIVGDAKQSIYRFRGADYRAYRQAVRTVEAQGGLRLDLMANFRSRPAVLDPVNLLFEDPGDVWGPSEHQPAYVAVQAVRPDGSGPPAVEVWTTVLGKPSAGARREAEGRRLAEAIERLRADGTIDDWSRVTLLLRAFTDIAAYLRPLRERGIPFVVDGGREFLRRPEVAQLRATLRSVSQPSDPAALLAFLRSPAGGVPDTELLAWSRERKGWSWYARPAPERFPALHAAFDRLRRIDDEIRDLPADRAVRRILERTDLLALSGAAYEGSQRVANLRKLAASAAELARDGHLSLDEVVEALYDGRLEDIATDRPLGDDAASAVRITSIHRMKGLENDWIFVGDLARSQQIRYDDARQARLVRLPDHGPALALRCGDVHDATWAWATIDDQRHDRAEELRVLYVALTRARERLVVLAGPPAQGRSDWIDALGAWGYDPGAPPGDAAPLSAGAVLHRRPVAAPPTERPGPPDPAGVERAVAEHERIVAHLTATRAPVTAPSDPTDDMEPATAGAPDAGASRALGKAVGIAWHRALDGWDGRLGTLRERLDRLVPELAGELTLDTERLREEVGAILAVFAESPLADALEHVEVLGHEVPMLLREGTHGPIYRGSIDLIYRDRSGLVVADFKTDRETDDVRLRERHGHQLEVYADAVHAAWGGGLFPPRAELWLLRQGRRLEL